MITTATELTQSQMMIWMGQQLNPSEPLYNMVMAFKINGQLNVKYFEEAFQKLVDQNDVLRSFIETKKDVPVQVFHSEIESPLKIMDFSSSLNAYERYLNWIEDHKKRLFAPNELLYHAVVFKISSDKFVFYFNQHHLITDGWSVKHAYDELNKNYQAIVQHREIATDNVNTFHSYAEKNVFREERETSLFWKSKLAYTGGLPSLYENKTTDFNGRSTRLNFNLGKDRTQKLIELTQDADIKSWTVELALSNIFLMVISTLIYKVGNQDEFTIGVPYHNRLNTKERKTLGLFMELLPVQISVEEQETFISLLKKVREESLEVIKNNMISKPPTALLKTFNVVMNFIPDTFSDFAGMPMESNWLLADHVDPNHQIRLQIQDFDNKENYKLHFDLNNDLFSAEQMNRIGQHFIQIIDRFIIDKNQEIGKLSIITHEEIKQLKELNGKVLRVYEDETLLSKFETQVSKTPNAIALLFDKKAITYQELHEKSNQVAHFLLQEGVKNNEIVAVSLERSLEMMVYIYGILKAGGAYLPLATSMPEERLRFILQNAKVKIMLCNHDKIGGQSFVNVKFYQIQDIAFDISNLDSNIPNVSVQPDDLAYVIYTSGSTGEPKGVKCHHKGICNRLNWMNAYYPITEEDTLLQKTPITFDVSVWELFWPLQVGSKLVIEIPDGHKDPERLIRTIVDNNITVVHFVPSMLNVFTTTKGVSGCLSLKSIFCSGEALSVSSVQKIHTALDVEVYNLYGPTEASVDVTSWHCKKGVDKDVIPIGYPVANTQLYILDKALNQVPIGVCGELYIAGVQVAQGYLNNNALTEEYFLEDIFSDSKDEKMYKTGDLARYREDGAIMYLGRIDNQIKLRGLRIELGEIEKTLEKHNAIVTAIVSVEKPSENKEFLSVYYTGETLEESDLSSFLAQSLPDYMIPSFYKHVKEFELLSSGKIDRKKLPKYSVESTQQMQTYLPPTNEFEEIISREWCKVMDLEKVGIDENFIRLGGNSLNAMVITSGLKTEFELDLPITLVFNYPTIKAYAEYVEETILELLSE